MKDIVYFSNHIRGPKGEAGARTWHQVNKLSESYRVTVIIPAIDPVSQKPVNETSYAGLSKENVIVKTVKTTKSDRNSFFKRTLFFLSAMGGQFFIGMKSERPSLVLTMSLPLTQLLVAWCVARLKRVPLGIDVRDFPFETAIEVGYLKSGFFSSLMISLESFLFRRADFVVTNSPRYVGFLKERGVKDEKITLALIGYDDFKDPDDEKITSWRKKLTKDLNMSPENSFIGVYAGTIGHAFPVEKIVEGAEQLTNKENIGFVLVGDGQRYNELRERVERTGANVLFLGRVSKDDVHAICRAVDFCIYPASCGRFSGAILGNKVFDYLGAVKPVLYIGQDSAVKDILEELGAGIFCGSSADDFADNVINLQDDSSLYISLVEGAKKCYGNGLTARNSANTFANVVDRYID